MKFKIYAKFYNKSKKNIFHKSFIWKTLFKSYFFFTDIVFFIFFFFSEKTPISNWIMLTLKQINYPSFKSMHCPCGLKINNYFTQKNICSHLMLANATFEIHQFQCKCYRLKSNIYFLRILIFIFKAFPQKRNYTNL